jgi:hypothetical protein
MIDDVSAELDREQDKGDPTRLTYGIVTANTDNSPLTVTVGGSTTSVPARKLAGYVPTVGEFVAILERGADRLVLGAVDLAPVAVGNLHYGTAFDGATSGTTLLTVGATGDIPISADRRIRVTLQLDRGWYGTAVADYFTIGIALDGVLSDSSTTFIYSTAAGAYLPAGSMVVQYNGGISAGDHEWTATAQRASGTGSLQFRGRLIVDDMGPA